VLLLALVHENDRPAKKGGDRPSSHGRKTRPGHAPRSR
jgi:hypothetical protein